MKYNIIFTLLTLTLIRAATISQMETMNIAADATYKLLQGSIAYKAKEAEKIVASEGTQKKGMFGILGSAIKNAFTSTPKSTTPQADLDELAMYYQAMNYADIMALDFLKKYCKQDGLIKPSTDPDLCVSYYSLMVKAIEGRIGALTSQYLYSDNLVKAPPEWPEHALEILTALEVHKASGGEYSVERSLIRMMKDKAEGRVENTEPLGTPGASPIEAMRRPPPPPPQPRFEQGNQGGYNQSGGQGGYNQGNQGSQYSNQGGQGQYGNQRGYGQNNCQMNQLQNNTNYQQNNTPQNNTNTANSMNQIANQLNGNMQNSQMPFNFDKMVPVAFFPASSLHFNLKHEEKESNAVESEKPVPVTTPQSLPQVQVPVPTVQVQPQPQPQVTQMLQPQAQVTQMVQPQAQQQQYAQPQTVTSHLILSCPTAPTIQSPSESSSQQEEDENFGTSRTRERNNLKAKSVIERPTFEASDPRLEKLYE